VVLITSLLLLAVGLYYEQGLLERSLLDTRAADSAYQYSQLERDLLMAALECEGGGVSQTRLVSLRHRSRLIIDSANFHWLSADSQQTLWRLAETLEGGDPAAWSCELFTGWAEMVHPIVIEAADLSNASRARLLVQMRELRRDMAMGFLVVVLLAGFVSLLAWRESRRQHERIASLESEGAFRERLIGMVAHELRTPVAIISGFAELLDCQGKSRDQIERIKRMALRLDQTLTSFLDLHRLQSGQPLAMKPREIDFAGLLREALEAVRIQYPQVDFRVEMDGGPVLVRGDEARLFSALQNLLSNAAKYGPAGEPVVVRLSREGGRVRVEVEDGGPPLSEEEVRAIFEPWSRLPRHRGLEGYGLGLPVVRESVRQHGGDLGWEPRGRRQVFWLELPLVGD